MHTSSEGSPRGRWLPALYLSLLLLLCALHAGRQLVGYDDFWAHAAVGRWIWQNQQVPRHTLFLWTANEPWVAHSWLSGLLFYGLLRLADSETYLMRIFTASMTVLTFALLWRFWRRQARITTVTALLFLLAIISSAFRFSPRAELFSSLFTTVLLLFLIARTDSSPGRETPWRYPHLLPAITAVLLFVAWVNLHGAVVTGLLFLGITAACDLVQDRGDARSRFLAVLTVLSGLAVCVNPYGLGYWQALQAVGGPVFANIEEWKPFWSPPARPLTEPVTLAILFACALAAWRAGPSRRWSQLAWLFTAAALFLTARRHTYLLALVCLAVMAANAGALDPEHGWQRLRPFSGHAGKQGSPVSIPTHLLWLARGTFVLLAGVYLYLGSLYFSPSLEGAPYLPEGVARVVLEHYSSARLFNDFENSSYFQWRFAGRPALFVDLLNAYPNQLLEDYHDILSVSPRGRQLLDERHIDLVVLTTIRPPAARSLQPLADYLDGNAAWARIYFPEDLQHQDGAIWKRRTSR